jgi:PIN domain nuclease of toxin-antitoxin system
LPIEAEHCVAVSNLPFHHRDPFDRLLVAQALVEELAVITADPLFSPYGIKCIW